MTAAPLTTVHQFHAGSAMGDAITNAMLLIRTQLRAQGFRSEIFVENRGSGLEREIRLMQQLPAHADYVLLVHHSMGFPGFDAILALPARKVLIYHNITPPELLRDVPRIERLAHIGREQLAILRDHVAFALADSDYNAVELHRVGFAAVRTCTLLFDVAALAARAAGLEMGVRPGDGVFTVLFVGRVTPSKAQDDLVAAFAAFRGRFAKPCRLVLVGALDPDEHTYLTALQDHIAAAGLEGAVQFTGLVSDAELNGWYRQADLYVSLSRHEGFGVPLVEAMAHGIPVVAWPTGAVPYTLGAAGTLLGSREPDAVAAAMLAAPNGVASVGRFALEHQLPVLLEALAAAGALPSADARAHAAVTAALRVAVAGPVGAATAAMARTIEAQRPGIVRIVPAAGLPMFAEAIADCDRGLLAALATRPQPEALELTLCGHSEAPALRGDLMVFAGGDIPIPVRLNGYDAAFARSSVEARALVDAGLGIPVLNPGPADAMRAAAALLLAPAQPDIRLAWISSWGVRCGVAEYSRALVDALPCDGVDLSILADDRVEADGLVRPAWQAGGHDLDPLLAAIGRADPEVAVIQHQPGLLPWSALAVLLGAMALDGRIVLVTLHNTRHLLELDAAVRAVVTAALRQAARVLVHTAADMATLAGLGIADRVIVLPHPAPPPAATLPRQPPALAPVIGCTGFFLPDKGIGALITAVASLRRRWPDVRLRLVNAEYGDPVSAAEIAACRRLAEAAGLAVEWHTEFIPLPRQAALLAGCDLLALPYQRSLEASSAALRNALASGVPVAVTPLPLFDEADGAVFRLPGCDPADIAAGLAELWADVDRQRQMKSAAKAWLAERAAPDIARRLHGIIRGLAAQRRVGAPLDGAPWPGP